MFEDRLKSNVTVKVLGMFKQKAAQIHCVSKSHTRMTGVDRWDGLELGPALTLFVEVMTLIGGGGGSA